MMAYGTLFYHHIPTIYFVQTNNYTVTASHASLYATTLGYN